MRQGLRGTTLETKQGALGANGRCFETLIGLSEGMPVSTLTSKLAVKSSEADSKQAGGFILVAPCSRQGSVQVG